LIACCEVGEILGSVLGKLIGFAPEKLLGSKNRRLLGFELGISVGTILGFTSVVLLGFPVGARLQARHATGQCVLTTVPFTLSPHHLFLLATTLLGLKTIQLQVRIVSFDLFQ
jgi:hypothetical protein